MTECPCPTCHGRRLRKELLAVTVGDLAIDQFCDLPVDQALGFMTHLELTPHQQLIGAQILKEIRTRLGFLQNVGLQYLTLSRKAGTLSGGESQRIRLATQIGSSLMGVLYILDEPSIGLHTDDVRRLIDVLQLLVEGGNTVLVIEHNLDVIKTADYLIDLGPEGGAGGGTLVCTGTPEEVAQCPDSYTGTYLKKVL